MRMTILFLFIALQVSAQEVETELPVYGPAKSLMGIMRGWNPSRFYPLDSSFHQYMRKYDRDLLLTPWRLDSFLYWKGFVWVRHSDTTFLPFKKDAKINSRAFPDYRR
jgi:hypothetical protein